MSEQLDKYNRLVKELDRSIDVGFIPDPDKLDPDKLKKGIELLEEYTIQISGGING